jgi:hypothetical protein
MATQQDVPIVRQAGLNIAGHSSADQLGCALETPESMDTPELPPCINPLPVFSHDSYSSIPPSYQDGIPLLRPSHFTGAAPCAAGLDHIHQSFTPSGETVSQYRMVYTYMPLCGAEKSRQEYTDGVIYVCLIFISPESRSTIYLETRNDRDTKTIYTVVQPPSY